MGWLNGHSKEAPEFRPNGSTAASVSAPATAVEAAGFPVTPVKTNGISFKKAVKYAAKGRVALVGPAGSGKSYTMLTLARALAGPHGRIAAIDTEHGSLSKYADRFDFDVIELDSFSPGSFVDALHAAEDAGYDVFCCDSLSHFWVGKDGALEFVDMASKRNRDQMGGWKEFRPHERLMVDEMVSSPCHVLCTMRTKTEYQEQLGDNGKKKRVKIGLAPVQRDGLEYEFDLVGYMDEENTFVVDKTRCPEYSQKAYSKPSLKEFAPFVNWLAGAARENVAPRPADPQIPTGGHPTGTREAAQFVAERKIAAGSGQSTADWNTMAACERAFLSLREAIGEVAWRSELERYGWKDFADIKRARDNKDAAAKELAKAQIVECYYRMEARKEGK